MKRLRGGRRRPRADDTRDDGELPARCAAASPSSRAQLRRARKRRASAAAARADGARTRGRPADPAAADAAIALGDSLAELRASLRAANDEAGLLTAPTESVQVVGESLRSAAEQLEAARGHLRALGKLLGVS